MSVFKKITQGLGINTAKVELQIPDSVPTDADGINGKVILVAQSNQKVKSVKVRLLAITTSGSGEEETQETSEVAKMVVKKSFEIKKDERQMIEFILPFDLGIEDGEPRNLFGKVMKFLADTPHSYTVVATVDLEGVALDPKARQSIMFT